jgi:hypothetical protein
MRKKPWYKQLFCKHAWKMNYRRGDYSGIWKVVRHYNCMNCGKTKIVKSKEVELKD